MRHPVNGVLLAYAEKQLSPQERQAVETHIEQCASCQARLHALASHAGHLSRLLATLEPGPLEQADASRALTALHTALIEKQDDTGVIPMLDKLIRNRNFQRALAVIGVLAVLVGLFSFAPMRALASEFLSLFRVERFAIVDVDPERAEEIAEAIEEDMFFGEEEILEEGDVTEVASLDEAAALAGFTPRAPQGYGEPSTIEVTGRQRMRFTPNVEDMRMVFSALELDPALLPDEMDGQPFDITVPASVALLYNLPDSTDEVDFLIGQVPSPTVDVPEGVDVQKLGEAMLQLLGMTPEEAARMSASIDWTTTLVVPVPSDLSTITEVQVEGTTGLLFDSGWHGDPDDPDDQGHLGVRTLTLLWQKSGIVTVITTDHGDSGRLLDIADSLK